MTEALGIKEWERQNGNRGNFFMEALEGLMVGSKIIKSTESGNTAFKLARAAEKRNKVLRFEKINYTVRDLDSKECRQCLDKLEKLIGRKIEREVVNLVPKRKYRVDGQIPGTNNIMEYNGCYHHGCPSCYPGKKPNARYLSTMEKARVLTENGYRLFEIWACYDEARMKQIATELKGCLLAFRILHT